MNAAIPSRFDEDFLSWFRERTEATWATLPARPPEMVLAEFVNIGAGGCVWRQGTRWLGGLTEQEIAGTEHRWVFAFPPDYRQFLRKLHTVNYPMLCARYWGKSEEAGAASTALARAPGHNGNQMVLEHGAAFYNWLTDTTLLERRFAWLWEGLQFDVEHNSLWLPSWGPKSATLGEQKVRVRELVEAAPKLVPIFKHRYLLAEPCAAGNPVLSVWQSDIVIYGADLRDYLLLEFADLLGLDEQATTQLTKEARARVLHVDDYATIPFWGELLSS